MTRSTRPKAVDYGDDRSLAEAISAGREDAFRWLMTQNNQRLFRVARGFLDSDHEAEDAVQQAYVNAFERIDSYRGDATIATWLTRIVINEAKQRLRNRKMVVDIHGLEHPNASGQVVPFPLVDSADPSAHAARSELRHSLEVAISALPPTFRAVFILREIEECSVEEAAVMLGVLPATIKTRLHRARRMVRASMEARAAASLQDAFHFQGTRCARTTERVIGLLKTRRVIVS